MSERAFVKIIQSCCLRLNIAAFLKKAVFILSIGAGVGILLQATAFIIPFYYVGLCTIIVLILALLTAVVLAFIKRKTMEQTALVMDGFGFEERIVTAYGNLGKEGMFVALQREDAMRQLQSQRDKIRIGVLPPWKHLAGFAGLFAILILLVLMPSAMKERARELHHIKEEAREKTEEVEEILETLEELAQEQDLTAAQQATLQEMIESLQASKEEFQQASSMEMMKAASQKLEYRYEETENALAALAQSLQNGATVSSVTAESMQALSEKLQRMQGTELAQGNSGQSGDPNGDGKSSNQNGNGQNGQFGNNSGNGQSSNSNGNGQNGQSEGDGANGSNGQGDQGDGSGIGRGTGTSSTPHDYVSIPNEIAESENLTGNAVNHDASEYFQAQNGLSWRGTHMSHEAVIGSYEQNAYEGIAAGKYPSGMEEIIKAYFSNFN